MSLGNIRFLFILPFKEAAAKLGCSPEILRKIYRENDLPNWPFRKLNAIDNSITLLKYLISYDKTNYFHRKKYVERIAALERFRFEILLTGNVHNYKAYEKLIKLHYSLFQVHKSKFVKIEIDSTYIIQLKKEDKMSIQYILN